MNDEPTGDRARTEPPRRRRPWRLLALACLVALGVVLSGVGWLVATSSGTAWLLARFELPDTLSVGRSEGSLARGLVLHDVALDADAFRAASPRLEVALGLDWAGRGLRVRELRLQDLDVVLFEGEEGAPAADMEALLADAAAPFPVTLEQGVVDGLRITPPGGEALEFDLLEVAGRWAGSLEALNLSLRGPWLEVSVSGGLALAEGRTDLELEAGLDARHFAADLPPDLVLVARAEGGLDRLPVRLRSESIGLDVDGAVYDPLGAARVEGQIALEGWVLDDQAETPVVVRSVAGDFRADLAGYDVDLAGELAGEGFPLLRWTLAGSGDHAELRLESLEVDAAQGSARATGTVAWGDPVQVDLDVGWRDLRWVTGHPAGDVLSPGGEGRLTGTPEDWRFTGAFGLEAPGYPRGRFDLDARGGTEAATVERLEGAVLGGAVSASGELEWVGAPRAAGSVSLERVDLGALVPEWPAVLSGAGSFRAEGGDAPALDLRVERLAGRLHGEPLQGAGRVALEDGAWRAEELRLALGDARFQADGSLGEHARFAVSLSVPSTGWVAGRLGGSIRGDLRVDTSEAFPLMAADLQVRGLALGGLEVARLDLERPAGASPRVNLEAVDLSLGDQRLDRLSGTLRPDGDAFALDLDGAAGEFRLRAGLAGRLADDVADLDLTWSGRLARLALERADQPLLTLTGEAPMALSRSAYRVEDACLEVRGDGTVCATVSGAPGDRFDLSLRLRDLSLALARTFSPHRLHTTQRLDGEATWSWRQGGQPSGRAAITVSPGEIGRAEDEDGLVATETGFIGFELDAGNLENGRIDLPLAGAGHVRADFTITGVKLDGTGQVRGAADLDLRSLAFLDSFLTQVDGIDGSLRSRLSLGGTVADPVFDGGFDLSGGRFELPALGAGVEALSLRGRVDGSDRLVLRGRFSAGPGEGRLELGADFTDLASPVVDFRVRGEAMAVARLPDLEVDASPDLRLGYAEGAWRLAGEVAVPRARITPVTSFVSRVDESPDVTVVAGELQPPPEVAETRPVQLEGEVAVRLGEDVRLEMDIASLGLGGGLDLDWAGDLVPAATGAITVDGSVTAWGPRLTITDGRVRWAGTPVTNPTLDLQAERDVFGNTLIRTAGVRVSGTARRPDIEAYTRPLTSSERAWTVLVTGSDINYAQGVGAVDVGTYIAPRVFLSYGISLFDSENVVGLRYDLRRGWGVKATSGQRESGIDLSYTIED